MPENTQWFIIPVYQMIDSLFIMFRQSELQVRGDIDDNSKITLVYLNKK